MSLGAPIALVRIVSISSVYFSLYVGSVIVLHRGLKLLHETVDLLRELLPDRKSKSAIPAGIDMDSCNRLLDGIPDQSNRPHRSLQEGKGSKANALREMSARRELRVVWIYFDFDHLQLYLL